MPTQPQALQHQRFGVALLKHCLADLEESLKATLYGAALLDGLKDIIEYASKNNAPSAYERNHFTRIMDEMTDAHDCEIEWAEMDGVEQSLHIIAIGIFANAPNRDAMLLAAHKIMRMTYRADLSRGDKHAQIGVIALDNLYTKSESKDYNIDKLCNRHCDLIESDLANVEEDAKHMHITNKYLEDKRDD